MGNNEQMLSLAKDILQEIDPSKLSGVRINTMDYRDGSSALTIDLDYPAKEEVEQENQSTEQEVHNS